MTPTHAIIHHSLTEDSKTVSWGAIRRYHMETQGWNEIGYQIGIELIGDYYEVLMGRPLTSVGAHTVGMNSRSIGICFIGNYDLAPPPDAMMDTAVWIITPLIDELDIPCANIHPHSKYADKTCPGRMFPMKEFVEALKRGYWK